MMDERYERDGSRSFLVFLAGGLIGAGLSLFYAPLSGEKTRQYLRIQTKRAKRKARHLTEIIREDIDHLIEEIKETTDKVIEEGIELTRERSGSPLKNLQEMRIYLSHNICPLTLRVWTFMLRFKKILP